jgi:hypothetical protein
MRNLLELLAVGALESTSKLGICDPQLQVFARECLPSPCAQKEIQAGQHVSAGRVAGGGWRQAIRCLEGGKQPGSQAAAGSVSPRVSIALVKSSSASALAVGGIGSSESSSNFMWLFGFVLRSRRARLASQGTENHPSSPPSAWSSLSSSLPSSLLADDEAVERAEILVVADEEDLSRAAKSSSSKLTLVG